MPPVATYANQADPNAVASYQQQQQQPGVLNSLGAAAATAGLKRGIGSLVGTTGGIGTLPAMGVAGGAALLGKGASDLVNGNSGDPLSRAQLGITTGGLSEFGRLFGLGGHETTKQAEAKRWGNLANQGIQGAAQQYQALQNLGPMSGKMHDYQWDDKGNVTDKGVTDWNFDKALNQVKHGLSSQFTGVAGNYETFGNDWAKLNPTQQNNVVSALANAGQYYSKKGDVLIKDPAQAKQIEQQALAGKLSNALQNPINQAQTPLPPGNLQGGVQPNQVLSTLGAANGLPPPVNGAPQPQAQSNPAIFSSVAPYFKHK